MVVEQVRDIGTFFGYHLKMDTQISKMCKNAWISLSHIYKIRHHLTEDQTKSVVHAYLKSELDCNNSLLAITQKTQLQCVQNATAKVILKKRKATMSFI